jgi:transposase InsO family protein
VLQPPVESGQYVAVRYTQRLADAGAVASVGSTGDSYDNALAEAFNSLFKAELIRNKGPWRSIDDLEIAVAEYLDWYNRRVESGGRSARSAAGWPRPSTGSLLVQLPLLALRVACVPSSAVTR